MQRIPQVQVPGGSGWFPTGWRETPDQPGPQGRGHPVGGRPVAVHLQGQVEPALRGGRDERRTADRVRRPLGDPVHAGERQQLVDGVVHAGHDRRHLAERHQGHPYVGPSRPQPAQGW
jgi:hypothetical protein